MEFGKYTERQQEIIDGKVSLECTTATEIYRLYVKALYMFDLKVMEYAEKELKRREEYVSDRKPYSKLQKSLIAGEIPIEDASRSELVKLFTNARKHGDKKVGELAEKEMKKREPDWFSRIEGYNAKQTQTIQGIIDIKSINDSSVRGMKRTAMNNCDTDVYEWASEEAERRGLKQSDGEWNYLYNIISKANAGRYDKLSDPHLAFFAYISRKEGKEEDLKAAEEEIRKRAKAARIQTYTEEEESIINGEIPLSEVGTWTLGKLHEKTVLDDIRDLADFTDKLEAEMIRQEEAVKTRAVARRTEYSSRQRKFADREIPLYKR